MSDDEFSIPGGEQCDALFFDLDHESQCTLMNDHEGNHMNAEETWPREKPSTAPLALVLKNKLVAPPSEAEIQRYAQEAVLRAISNTSFYEWSMELGPKIVPAKKTVTIVSTPLDRYFQCEKFVAEGPSGLFIFQGIVGDKAQPHINGPIEFFHDASLIRWDMAAPGMTIKLTVQNKTPQPLTVKAVLEGKARDA